MNHIYRLIWSDITRTWVAVAETAKGRGKRASGTAGTGLGTHSRDAHGATARGTSRLRLRALAASLALIGAPAWALDPGALPTTQTQTQGQGQGQGQGQSQSQTQSQVQSQTQSPTEHGAGAVLYASSAHDATAGADADRLPVIGQRRAELLGRVGNDAWTRSISILGGLCQAPWYATIADL